MKNKIPLIGFLLMMVLLASAQKVGVVLSGGGAKGMAHLGVLQALEDNEIPIDYITGTSIGAVVGSLYAMGYSPVEMVEIFKSEEFAYWQTGETQEKYVYSYKRKDPEPDIFTIKFSITDSLIIEPKLPMNVISPIQMNAVFLALYSQATAACGGNFDRLFVPFRCMASDVYRKESITLNKGDLGDAVRASMTFPFIFRPIEIDGRILFDGGIYDNFPLTAMRRDFHPDYIVGSAVADNPDQPNAKNLKASILNMVMVPTDYSINKDEGVLLDFSTDLDRIKLLDFYKIDAMYQLAYDSTINIIDQIRAKVSTRRSKEELRERRKAFRATFPELRFKTMKVSGVNTAQQRFIANSFHEKDKYIDIEEFRKSYFKLMADNHISEIRPTAVYDSINKAFDLLLNVKLDDNFYFAVGGNMSSSVSSQAFFGLRYQRLQSRAWTNDLTAQFGRAYNGLQFTSQVDFPSVQLPCYLKLTGNIQGFYFYENNKPFYQDEEASYFVQQERYLKFGVDFPSSFKSKMGVGVGIARLYDSYYQSPLDFMQHNKDRNRYDLANLYYHFQVNTLNDKQYANEGQYLDFVTQIVSGNERYNPSSLLGAEIRRDNILWWQSRLLYEQYFLFGRHLTLGIMGDAAYSTHPLGDNYTASILQAPAFNPTVHSRYIFNPAFSANQFVAGGAMPMYNFTRQLSLRGGFYGFLPLRPTEKDENLQARYGDYFSTFEYIGEVAFVFRLPFLSASVFVNYYSSPAKNWNFGFNIGYLLFNKRFLD
ncbi:MAG: patatin-like phospholipase family protein [Prevotellaceae bacterium]|jgi:NTE family protein|nr:patatin-like phospholipase family protein [Prevotellaceae bacterium]